MTTVDDPRIGEIVVPTGIPTMSETPPVLRHTGRAMGADTDAVLEELLGLSGAAIERLRAARVV
jgi:crotonobetainyl-CoA:carnitine CoA-transferase CaiB-like acyl-CoA transferase